MTQIRDAVVLVTGAAGGLGTALIEELLQRGAAKIYAGVRKINPDTAWPAAVIPLELDIADPAQVAAAAMFAPDVGILINNAGLNLGQPMLSVADPRAARAEMEVNYFGTLAMCRAFAPMLAVADRGGAIVNLLSILARVSLPIMGSLCASKAAALRLTDSLRAELAGKVQVLGVLPGVIDTAMSAGFPTPKATPQAVAAALLDALEQGAHEVYPDGMSLDVARRLGSERAAVNAEFAGFL